MTTVNTPTLVIDSYEPGLDAELRKLEDQFPDVVRLVAARGFAGTSDTLQAVVPLVPVTMAVLSLVATWIRAKRHMSVKVGGVEITGMSPRETERILQVLRDGGSVEDALGAVPTDDGPLPSPRASDQLPAD